MKKVLFVLIAGLLLGACGEVSIHENVDEEIAKDALQVMDKILYNVENNIAIEDVTEEEHRLFERFTDRYIHENDAVPMYVDGVDESIVKMASGSLVSYAKGASLESDKENIKENYEYMIKFIETGESAAN